MIRSIVFKELWDVRGVAVGAGVVFLLLLANFLGMPLPTSGGVVSVPADSPPFLGGDFVWALTIYGGLFAVALGFRQSTADGAGNRWLFLLHQPMTRRDLLLCKLATGLSLWTVGTYGVLLLGVALANTPGLFPAPFEWWMLDYAWTLIAHGSLLYLGAFLSGLRPAWWFGTRLLPVAGCVIVPEIILGVADLMLKPLGLGSIDSKVESGRGFPFALSAAIAAVDGLLIAAILTTARDRDFP